MEIKAGDLVRFTKNPKTVPPNVIPLREKPIGIVIGVEKFLTSENDEMASIFTTVRVIWSNDMWNGDKGFSKECDSDLIIIQRCNL